MFSVAGKGTNKTTTNDKKIIIKYRLHFGVVIPLAFAGHVVVLDQKGLDVLGQLVVVFGCPVAQDAGGELVLRVTRPTQHHFHHLLCGTARIQTCDVSGRKKERKAERTYVNEAASMKRTFPCEAVGVSRIKPQDALQRERERDELIKA